MTDKVSMEMPCPADGVLTNILVDAGQTVPMGTVIAEIEVEGEELVQSEAQESHATAQVASPVDRIGTLVKDATNVGPTGSGGPITTGIESDEPSTRAR